jgi:hypothetical protein
MSAENARGELTIRQTLKYQIAVSVIAYGQLRIMADGFERTRAYVVEERLNRLSDMVCAGNRSTEIASGSLKPT